MFSFFWCGKKSATVKLSEVEKNGFATLQALRMNRVEDAENKVAELHQLLQSDAINPNVKDEKGWTFFHRVVHAEAKLFNRRGIGKINRDSLTQLCIAKQADLNSRTDDRVGVTALQLAGTHESLRDLLLANGAYEVNQVKLKP